MKHIPDKTIRYPAKISPRVKRLQHMAPNCFVTIPMKKVNICISSTSMKSTVLGSLEIINMQDNNRVTGDIFLEEEYPKFYKYMDLEGRGQAAFRDWNNLGIG